MAISFRHHFCHFLLTPPPRILSLPFSPFILLEYVTSYRISSSHEWLCISLYMRNTFKYANTSTQPVLLPWNYISREYTAMIVWSGIERMKFEKLMTEVIELPCLFWSVMRVDEFLRCLMNWMGFNGCARVSMWIFVRIKLLIIFQEGNISFGISFFMTFEIGVIIKKSYNLLSKLTQSGTSFVLRRLCQKFFWWEGGHLQT